MKHAVLAACLAAASFLTHAQDLVKVADPWVRGTVAGQPATGAFMKLTPSQNTRLVAASSPVAGVVEIHEMVMVDQVMKMRQIPGLDLPAGRTTELKPGGYHVMLMALKRPIQGGESVPITLVFEDAAGKRQTQDIVAPAAALGQRNSASGPAMHHH